jgi:hypothetical protein
LIKIATGPCCAGGSPACSSIIISAVWPPGGVAMMSFVYQNPIIPAIEILFVITVTLRSLGCGLSQLNPRAHLR